MNKKVSVIVPIYNVEAYLNECVDSLLHQTLQDIEILLVDDGSSDGCPQLVDAYAKEYPDKIIALHKENGGLSDARNYGLKYATADYIAFVDSDDWVLLDTYEKAYTCAIEHNCDIVFWDLNWVYPDGTTKVHTAFASEYQELNAAGYMFADPSACNKLFRRDLLNDNDISFPKGIWYEDMSTIPGLIQYTKKMQYLPTAFYQYRQRNQSIMYQEKYNKKLLDIVLSMEHLYGMIKDSAYQKELEYLFIFQLLYFASARFMQFNKYEDIDTCYQTLCKYYPNWQDNVYYKGKPKLFRIYCELLSNGHYRSASILMKVKQKVRG